MDPTTPKPGNKPSLGEGLGNGLGLHSIRKTASCEPLGRGHNSSDDDSNRGGGARFETTSDILSPGPDSRAQTKRSLENNTPVSTRSSNYMVFESSDDGDVFVDNSPDAAIASPAEDEKPSADIAVYGGTRNKIDPQTVYAGSSCMFAANLPQHISDDQLELEVTRVFSSYGTVFVKIKRDLKGMPFAFCQYRVDEEAEAANTQGRGSLIFGRPCRTEMARAHSSFIVYKRSGQRIRLSEAKDLLRRLGEISNADFLEEGLRLAARLPHAAVIKYKMYDQRRDPVRTFAGDPTFCVKVYDPKALAPPSLAPSHSRARDDQSMVQYDKDRHSAFMGNLPLNITKDVLRALASTCGEVLEVQVHHKRMPSGEEACFAFVEFARIDSVDELVRELNKTDIDGRTIRVERKHARLTEPARRPASAAQTPRRFTSAMQTPQRLALPAQAARPWTHRPRVGSFELEKSSQRHCEDVGNTDRPGRRGQYASHSFTPGRSRKARPTILGDGSSPRKGIFATPSPTKADPASEDEVDLLPTAAHMDESPKRKKSVDFDLNHRIVSHSSVESEASAPEAPSATKSTAEKETPGNSAADKPYVAHPPVAHPPVALPPVAHPPVAHSPVAHLPMAHPPMTHPPMPYPTMAYPSMVQPNDATLPYPLLSYMHPQYTPVMYGYMPPTMGAQGAPAPMYPTYMPHPMYSGYDMYGAMMHPASTLMPAIAPFLNESPAAPQNAGYATAELAATNSEAESTDQADH